MTDLLPGETDAIAVSIERLGARGDGIAPTKRGPLFVAGALPGETATVALAREGDRARLLSVDAPSPDRVEPFCPHFGACGGCSVQHLAPAPYAAWKRGILEAALAGVGVATQVAPLVDARGAGRRRITLHARVEGGATRVGFMAARSHALVDVDACPAAEPGLSGAARAAREVARLLRGRGKPLDVQATATEGGLDLDVRGYGPLEEGTRRALVAAAEALDLARLSVHGDVVVERRPPLVRMGRAAALPPPGGFLQATAAGEAALAALVEEATAGAKTIADLFCGVGPFALRLAERARVHAVDGDAGAVRALDRAFRAAPGLRPIAVETRDLFRRPLLSTELAAYDAVVLDPPRAGAEAQARRLAETPVAALAYVSCDPGTFARDAAILVGAGYSLLRATPVDQFAHTGHVEIVGAFRGPKRPRRR